jgi:hypothetical protein
MQYKKLVFAHKNPKITNEIQQQHRAKKGRHTPQGFCWKYIIEKSVIDFLLAGNIL